MALSENQAGETSQLNKAEKGIGVQQPSRKDFFIKYLAFAMQTHRRNATSFDAMCGRAPQSGADAFLVIRSIHPGSRYGICSAYG